MSIRVSPSFLVLGTASYGVDPDEATSFSLLDAYVENGGTVIDTARCYSDWVPGESGRSEKLIGRWLKARGCRDQIILSTKGGHPPMSDFSQVRLSPHELKCDLEASMLALGVDQIDLYWLHRDDLSQPIERLLETLEDFRNRGWIRQYGASNFCPQRLMEAQNIAAKNGWDGFHASQPMACLGVRYRKPAEIPLLEIFDEDGERFHQRSNLPLYPYTSQATGYYAKVAQFGASHPDLKKHPFNTPNGNDLAKRLSDLSKASGFPVSVLTLAWWRTKQYPSHPIIGCRTLEQLTDSFQATRVDDATLVKLSMIEQADAYSSQTQNLRSGANGVN